MPPEERPAKVIERCAVHPDRAAAVRCADCDRPLCIRCAVPVRGRALGPECLRAALGDDAPPAPERKRPRRPTIELVAGGAFFLAAAASLLPWTSFASGSGFAGAWALDLRWSMLAALMAVAGLGCWAFSRHAGQLGIRLQIVLGLSGSIGAIMAIVHPPPFKHASVSPVVALILLLVGTTAVLIRVRQASDLHR